jgi:hypothetical protein
MPDMLKPTADYIAQIKPAAQAIWKEDLAPAMQKYIVENAQDLGDAVMVKVNAGVDAVKTINDYVVENGFDGLSEATFDYYGQDAIDALVDSGVDSSAAKAFVQSIREDVTFASSGAEGLRKDANDALG